jgi:FixJ family two-component response regulator
MASAAHCLVIDVRLGDITGIELSRQLASMGLQLPTIFITCVKDPYTERQVSELGHTVFLEKFRLAERLVPEVERLLGSV